MKRDTPELLDSCMANYIPGNVETFPRMVFTIFNLSNRNISQLRWSFCENYGIHVTSRQISFFVIFLSCFSRPLLYLRQKILPAPFMLAKIEFLIFESRKVTVNEVYKCLMF